MNANVLAIRMMRFSQKDLLTPITVHSDFEGQGKSEGTWNQASAIWRLLLVVLHSSVFFWWHLHFFLPPSWSYESSWIKKSLHYKTIRSEASGNAAGICCSLPTAAVRDGGGRAHLDGRGHRMATKAAGLQEHQYESQTRPHFIEFLQARRYASHVSCSRV